MWFYSIILLPHFKKHLLAHCIGKSRICSSKKNTVTTLQLFKLTTDLRALAPGSLWVPAGLTLYAVVRNFTDRSPAGAITEADLHLSTIT